MKPGVAISTVIILLVSSFAMAANYESTYSSSHALVVGINKYRFWSPLEYAVKDANEIAAVLKAQGFQIYTLTNEKATRKNILRKLDTIRHLVDENSRVVFYFAGHGQTEDLPGGKERGYIVPVDADGYDWKRTMLPMDQLNKTIKQIKAKHILMAFDSCYSGLGLTRSIKRHPEQDAAYIQKMMHSRSIQILTAGSRSEQAIEAEGHGLFTDHLLAALSGAADINSDGYVTATEIYATLRPSITKQSYSRQTPQFGYIEGNGDIIFKHTPQKLEHATVLINTRIDGIDVWAGNSEIGHRLPAGQHRLTANTGQTTVMVKKGGRTLYLKKVMLRMNQVFPIQIPSTAHISYQPKAFTMRTISNRNVENYSNSLAYDLDRDGKEEIVTAEGNHLYVFNSKGSPLWQKKFNFQINLDLVDNWNAQPAIGLSAKDKDNVHLVLLNHQGHKIWHHIRKISRNYGGKPDGNGRIAKLVDVDLDGYEEIIALATAEGALKPRGVIVYNQSGKELWRYTIGPIPQNMVIWEKEMGRPDIIIGTYSSGDGNHEPYNTTDDMNAYVISIDGYGKSNWITRIGTHYTGVNVMLAQTANSHEKELYAYKYTSFQYREDEGAVFKISRSGQIIKQYDTKNSILSMTSSRVRAGHSGYLYLADNHSNLYKLDHRLNLLHKKSLNPESDSQEIRLVGVHDYDGDGLQDLLLYSYESLMKDKNPLSMFSPRTNVFYSNLKIQIISQNFTKFIKTISIAEDWEKWDGFTVKELDRLDSPHYPFMALGDKITIYNY